MTEPSTQTYVNPSARQWRTDPVTGAADYHRTLPGYESTRLVELPHLASELGVGRVFVKEEASRLGLPAFKILGASYAVAKALAARLGIRDRVPDFEELRGALADVARVTLIAATDGNHGRAVAHMARLLGLPSRIYYPADITEGAKRGIAEEGAEAVELADSYDSVVRAASGAAREAGDTAVLVQDTGWAGYATVPQWIVDGYSTLLEEADAQLAEAGAAADVVAVPVGVGSLAQAVVRHYRSGSRAAAETTVLSVEPVDAPAVIASLHAGRAISVLTSHTVMTGLNCGTPSELAWPVLKQGLDAAVAVDDAATITAVRDLERLGVDAGPCGAATLAGIRAFASTASLAPDATVLLLSTESRTANPLPPA